MLFDSLLFRAMGQKYARQDIDPSAPNRSVSSKVFFLKFPKLHKYLLDELTRDVSLLENNEVLLPVALVISGYCQYWVISNTDFTFSSRYHEIIRFQKIHWHASVSSPYSTMY